MGLAFPIVPVFVDLIYVKLSSLAKFSEKTLFGNSEPYNMRAAPAALRLLTCWSGAETIKAMLTSTPTVTLSTS